MTTRDDCSRFFDAVPDHVLTVVDEAYFEYVDDPTSRTRSRRARSAAAACSRCGRSRRSTGSPGCASATGSGPQPLIAAIGKVRRAFDVTTPAQEAALASLDGAGRARAQACGEPGGDGCARGGASRAAASSPLGPAVGNFLFVDVGEDAAALDDALLRRGVIVRPMGSFGAPTALRITAGTPDEIAFLAEQLERASSRRPNGSLPAAVGYRSAARARGRPFPHANDTEERSRPRRDAERQRPGRRSARAPRAGHDLPPAACRRREAAGRSRCASSAGRCSCSRFWSAGRREAPTSTSTSPSRQSRRRSPR